MAVYDRGDCELDHIFWCRLCNEEVWTKMANQDGQEDAQLKKNSSNGIPFLRRFGVFARDSIIHSPIEYLI